MSKIIKLNEKQLNNIVNKVMGEGKKQPKKEKDSKYDKWCKEHGFENGVGSGCADAALDSKEGTIIRWGIRFLMSDKDTTIKEQRFDPDRYQETSDNGYDRLMEYLQPLVDQDIIHSDIRDDILNLAGDYADDMWREGAQGGFADKFM